MAIKLCKPLYDSVPLKEISWAVTINGSLTRGVPGKVLNLSGCKNEAGTCKFENLTA